MTPTDTPTPRPAGGEGRESAAHVEAPRGYTMADALRAVSIATGIEHDRATGKWWVPGDPSPQALPTLTDALMAALRQATRGVCGVRVDCGTSAGVPVLCGRPLPCDRHAPTPAAPAPEAGCAVDDLTCSGCGRVVAPRGLPPARPTAGDPCPFGCGGTLAPVRPAAAPDDAAALGFTVEDRGGIRVVQDRRGVGCRPATNEECALWDALAAARAREGAAVRERDEWEASAMEGAEREGKANWARIEAERRLNDAEREVTRLRSLVDELSTLRDRSDAQLDDVSAAIGTVEFMDPPDGGDVSLAEQVRRMRAALDEARREREGSAEVGG